MPSDDLALELLDFALKAAKLRNDHPERGACFVGQHIPGRDKGGNRSLDASRPLGGHEPELGEMAAQGVHKHRSLTDQQVAGLVQHQDGLLIHRLHRDEAHRWPGHGFADRLGIGGIGLATLDIGFHIGWRHEPDIMTQLEQFTRPMMRRRAGFHAHQARGELPEKDQNLAAPKAALHDRATVFIDAVNLDRRGAEGDKIRLGQIQTDHRNPVHLPKPSARLLRQPQNASGAGGWKGRPPHHLTQNLHHAQGQHPDFCSRAA